MKYFDEIIVITLNRSESRKQNVINQLNKLNLSYKLFNGFDAHDIKNESFKNIDRISSLIRSKNPRALFRTGSICCNLSHIAAIKFAEMMNYDKVLILEDDIYMANDFVERLRLIDDVPDDADMIFLGGDIRNENKINTLPKKHKITKNVINRKGLFMFGTHTYIINKSAYEKVVKIRMNFNESGDALLLRAHHLNKTLNSYTVIPWSTYQIPSISEIDNRFKSMNSSKTFYSDDCNLDNMYGYKKINYKAKTLF